MKIPRISDIIRFYIKANKEIRINLKDPKIYYFNFTELNR